MATLTRHKCGKCDRRLTKIRVEGREVWRHRLGVHSEPPADCPRGGRHIPIRLGR